MDIKVLDDMHREATDIAETNPWLTYGEPLHRAREFGMMVPALDVLRDRQLTRNEVHAVVEMLLSSESEPSLPHPEEQSWSEFVSTAQNIVRTSTGVYSPLQEETQPWILIDKLVNFKDDPVSALIDQNDELLWKTYVCYAFNAALIRELEAPTPTNALNNKPTPLSHTKRLAKMKSPPVYRSAAKYEKRLLRQDDFWAMCNDFGLVPSLINTIRYNKIINELGDKGGRKGQDGAKVKISFREFIKILIRFSESAFPKMDRANRLARLMTVMESTGNMARIGEHGSFTYEGVAMDMPLVTRKSRDEFRSPTPPPPPVGRNQKKPSVPRFNSPSRGSHQLTLSAPSVSGSVTDPSVVRLLEELYSTINYADKRCFVLDGQIEKANDQLARMRKKLQEVKPAKEAAERRAAELEQLGHGYENEINALRSEIQALKAEIKDLKKHIKDMSGDQRAGIKSVTELEGQMAKMRDEINAGRRDRGNSVPDISYHTL